MDRVLIPFGSEVLLLTREQFDAAREAGREALRTPDQSLSTHGTAPVLLSAAQLAERFNLPRSTVYELRKAGKLEAVRCGRHLRFDADKAYAALSRRQ